MGNKKDSKKHKFHPAPQNEEVSQEREFGLQEVPKYRQWMKFDQRQYGAGKRDQMHLKPEERTRPDTVAKIHPDEDKVDLPGFVAPIPTETHAAFHSEMCRDLDKLGDRWKYPQASGSLCVVF